MLNSIKSKLTFIYISLIILILFVGISSVYNIQVINQYIDKIMVDNYKSISLVSKMMEAVENQNINVTNYLLGIDKNENINNYEKNKEEFMNYYYQELDNITEEQERDYAESLLIEYNNYLSVFFNLQNMADNITKIDGYYIKDINESYAQIKENLNNILEINQKALLDKKNLTANKAVTSRRIVFFITVVSAVFGYTIASALEKKMLLSIEVLSKRIKNIREGNIGEQIQEVGNDELGEVIYEFNRMSKRLEEFEKSTLGKVLKEKNKSIYIIKSIEDPIIVLDDALRIVMINDRSEAFFDIKERIVINKMVNEVIKEEVILKILEKFKKEKLIKNNEKVLELIKENKRYFFDVSVNVIKSDRSKIDGYVLVLKDITEIKQIEIAKENFRDAITHEIKTPITSIMIGTGLINDKKIGELNDEQSKIVNNIASDADRLNNLVNNILNMSKLESSKMILNYTKCFVEDLIKASITTLSQIAKEKNIIVDYEVEEEIILDADCEKVIWVINNLISNAIKICDEWDVITVRAFKTDKEIIITVTDTGIGIAEDMINNIFDKYVQADNKQNNKNGVGLGLAIAKSIVKAHKGEIWCESVLGLGSTFSFTLPLM